MAFDSVSDQRPCRPKYVAVIEKSNLSWVIGSQSDDLCKNGVQLPIGKHLLPSLAVFVFDQERVSSREFGHRTQSFGMIRNHEKIQGAINLHACPMAGMYNRQALGKTKRSIRVRRGVAQRECVEGIRRVQVRIAPEKHSLVSLGARKKQCRQAQGRSPKLRHNRLLRLSPTHAVHRLIIGCMNGSKPQAAAWPPIPYAEWQSTAAALHLYLQIVGKYRLAHSPWVNHSWHATFYVTPRGLTTSLIPDGDGGIEVQFDFINHTLMGRCGNGMTEQFALEPMSVADFHRKFVDLIDRLGGEPEFHGSPNELPDPVPFTDDKEPRPYDADATARFHRAMVTITKVFQLFRTGYGGKVSPVHLFWGSFDLAVTRFSGRRAPLHPGGLPHLPDAVTQEAYSHEVSSAGFWAGGGPVDEPAFYAYAYPAPEGFAEASVQPDAAYFDKDFGEFVLPYEAVRQSTVPEATLMAFLESTYEAAAALGDWDRTQEFQGGLRGEPPKID